MLEECKIPYGYQETGREPGRRNISLIGIYETVLFRNRWISPAGRFVNDRDI